MKERDKNNHSYISLSVRGIGVLSDHGKELNEVGDQELKTLIDRLQDYTKDEQYYILSRISSELCGELLDRGEDPEDPEDPS
jgi:hypothetical protein